MDGRQFDALAKLVATNRTRRGVLRMLVGGAAGGVFALLGEGGASARARTCKTRADCNGGNPVGPDECTDGICCHYYATVSSCRSDADCCFGAPCRSDGHCGCLVDPTSGGS